jgi:hypothetical protein
MPPRASGEVDWTGRFFICGRRLIGKGFRVVDACLVGCAHLFGLLMQHRPVLLRQAAPGELGNGRDRLAVHLMSSSHRKTRSNIRRWRFPPEIAPFVRQIWPIANDVVTWPISRALPTEVIDILADHFFRRAHRLLNEQYRALCAPAIFGRLSLAPSCPSEG